MRHWDVKFYVTFAKETFKILLNGSLWKEVIFSTSFVDANNKAEQIF